MEEVEEQFKRQFDPNDPTYHNSQDKRPIVPYSGVERVPSSMPNEFPENSVQQEEEPDYGPEYDAVINLRETVGELKKAISALVPPLEAIIRLKSKSASESDIQKEIEKRDNAIAKVIELKDKFSNSELEEKKDIIESLVEGASKDYSSAEELFDFSKYVTRESQKCFSDQKKLLEKVKKIKREYNSKK